MIHQNNESKSFDFQLTVAFSYFFLAQKISKCKKRFLVQERSLLSVLTVFIPLLQCSQQKKSFLTAQTQNLLKRIRLPNLVVILDTPIDICVSRIITRDRFQEKNIWDLISKMFLANTKNYVCLPESLESLFYILILWIQIMIK